MFYMYMIHFKRVRSGQEAFTNTNRPWGYCSIWTGGVYKHESSMRVLLDRQSIILHFRLESVDIISIRFASCDMKYNISLNFIYILCLNFDVLFIHDILYISILIVYVWCGQEEYSYAIHSNRKIVISQIRLEVASLCLVPCDLTENILMNILVLILMLYLHMIQTMWLL